MGTAADEVFGGHDRLQTMLLAGRALSDRWCCVVAGNFTATLKARALYNRTLIVMTSGECSSAFWRRAKEGQGLDVGGR